jgi:hypothetical protein
MAKLLSPERKILMVKVLFVIFLALIYVWLGMLVWAPKAHPAAQPADARCFKDGQEVRCKDGRYHDSETGKPQPDVCDNSGEKDTGKYSHHCACARTQASSCEESRKAEPTAMGAHCGTQCRKESCTCTVNCT